MREYTKQSVTTERKVLTKKTCDLCGKVAVKNRTEEEWNFDYYEVADVVVNYREGKSYPECDSYGTEYSVDICPDCFKSKLIPWLQSQGATVQEKEWCC